AFIPCCLLTQWSVLSLSGPRFTFYLSPSLFPSFLSSLSPLSFLYLSLTPLLSLPLSHPSLFSPSLSPLSFPSLSLTPLFSLPLSHPSLFPTSLTPLFSLHLSHPSFFFSSSAFLLPPSSSLFPLFWIFLTMVQDYLISWEAETLD
ncbi:hypothetical protein J4Q44_G00002070, partial [Coregonus suidteri]